ncbi:hypothetical protein [Microvirga sp. 2YAF29]|uniref:hypothetical protein n=1 Tax=Microvirga sp. 2YAF29 TaxID=3233031 RepID=UPI003F98D09E
MAGSGRKKPYWAHRFRKIVFLATSSDGNDANSMLRGNVTDSRFTLVKPGFIAYGKLM